MTRVIRFNAEYEPYLDSDAWDTKRKQRLALDGHKCSRCQRDNVKLDVHHITYERIGRERMTDLISLCRRCHRREHGHDTSLPPKLRRAETPDRLRPERAREQWQEIIAQSLRVEAEFAKLCERVSTSRFDVFDEATDVIRALNMLMSKVAENRGRDWDVESENVDHLREVA